MSDKKFILINTQTTIQKMVSDTYTLIVMCGPILLGWVLGSIALQWMGIVLSILYLLNFGILKRHSKTMTLQEAKEYLKDV